LPIFNFVWKGLRVAVEPNVFEVLVFAYAWFAFEGWEG